MNARVTPRRQPDSVEIGNREASSGASQPDRPQGRPWLGVFFRCCQVYARLYRNAAGTAYSGRCPRCGSEVSARVGPGGTSRRMFFAE